MSVCGGSNDCPWLPGTVRVRFAGLSGARPRLAEPEPESVRGPQRGAKLDGPGRPPR